MRALVLVVFLSALMFFCSFSEAATLQPTALFSSGDQVLGYQLDSIPGRQALKLALITMGRTELTQAQRLKIAEPLFQQAIGASEEIDINEINSELRAIAREAAQSTPEEKERLGPHAVELLETIKQPLQARLLFAVSMQNAAAESNNQRLNERAIKWLQSIELKDPGAKLDAAVQGCLSICRRQPLCTINEEDALSLGQIVVESNRAATNREASGLDWQRVAGSAAELLLGMVFCWGTSLLAKMVVKGFRKERVH